MITSEFFFKRFFNRSSRKNNCSEVEKLDDFENKTFEHRKKSDVAGQKDALLPLRPIWLQSPPNILYQLFPREALARVKVQLQVLQDLLKMDTQYQIMEANNGTFWKIPVSA